MTKRSPLLTRIATFILFVALEIFSVMLIANNSVFQQLRVMEAYMKVQAVLTETKTKVTYYCNLDVVNEQLMAENTKLLSQLSKYKTAEESVDSIRVDSTFIKTIDSTGVKEKFSYIPAKIIANSTNKKHNFIIINRGRLHGIKKDMGVISPNGVVGVISAVSDNYAYIISFLNVNQSISSKISNTNAFGPLIWDGKRANYAVLTEVPQHIKFHVGDTVNTSGYSSLYPPDIALGTIGRSKIIKGTHHEIQVRLFQDFKTLQFVRVVINHDKEEIEKLSTNESEVK